MPWKSIRHSTVSFEPPPWSVFPTEGHPPRRRIEAIPSWTARGYPPHGQLEGIPLTDRKRLPPSRLSKEALPPQKTTSPEAHLEPRAEPSAEPRAELLACTWRLEAHAPRDRTFYEAWQPPRRLGNSKRGFLVGRKYFRTCPQTLEPHTTWLQVCVNALFHRFRASKVRFSALSRIVR